MLHCASRQGLRQEKGYQTVSNGTPDVTVNLCYTVSSRTASECEQCCKPNMDLSVNLLVFGQNVLRSWCSSDIQEMQESWLEPRHSAKALVIHAVSIILKFYETFRCMRVTYMESILPLRTIQNLPRFQSFSVLKRIRTDTCKLKHEGRQKGCKASRQAASLMPTWSTATRWPRALLQIHLSSYSLHRCRTGLQPKWKQPKCCSFVTHRMCG